MKMTTRRVLSKVASIPNGDAYWTSDIAYDARLDTAKTRRELQELKRLGYVEVVAEGGQGYPTSWRVTPSGLLANLAGGTNAE